MTETAMTLDNGLSRDEDDKLDDLRMDLARIRRQIEEMGRHRSYSLAVTKIEEADHWLRDRKNKAK